MRGDFRRLDDGSASSSNSTNQGLQAQNEWIVPWAISDNVVAKMVLVMLVHR